MHDHDILATFEPDNICTDCLGGSGSVALQKGKIGTRPGGQFEEIYGMILPTSPCELQGRVNV